MNRITPKLLTLYLLTMFSCSTEVKENIVLKNEINGLFANSIKLKKDEKLTFKMDTMTHFKWDKMYVFSAYSTEEQIKKKIGIDWSGARYLENRENLFVFIFNNQIASFVLFSPNNLTRKDSNFICSICGQGKYLTNSSLFEIKKTYYGKNVNDCYLVLS